MAPIFRTDRSNIRSRFIGGAVAALVLFGVAMDFGFAQAGGLDAQRQAELEGVQIQEKLGEQLPLDLTFTDSTGEKVKLGDYFGSDKPVVLNFVYFECPMLCTIALNGTSDVLRQTHYTPGDEFNLVTISFNHEEGPELSSQNKANYIEQLGKPEAASGWHFLTGDEATIKKATDAAGFGFKWVQSQGQYAHGAALFVLTPDGRFSRVLKGIAYDAKTLQLSVVEASDGKVGSVSDKLLMYCFAYDPTTGQYGPAAMKLMRLGAAMTVVIVILTIAGYRLHEKRRIRKSNAHHVQPDAA